MKTSDFLRAARSVIASETAWTTGCNARTVAKFPVVPESDLATCFCSQGALLLIDYRVYGKTYYQEASPDYFRAKYVLDAAANMYGGVTRFNDGAGRTHAQVLELFDEAISISEKEEVQ